MGMLKIGCARIGFACLGAFAGLDALTRLILEDYRDAMGTTDEGLSILNVGIIALDVSLTVFYGSMYLKMRKGGILPRVMVWHGLLYGVLGLILCLPWTYFLAPLTPVCVLYLGIFFWTPFGWHGAQGVAAAFVTFNIYSVWAGLTSVTKMVSSPRVS